MKTLLTTICLALLLMASSASATFFLTAEGQDVENFEVVIGEVVTIGIWSTDSAMTVNIIVEDSGGHWFGIPTPGPATLAGGTYAPHNWPGWYGYQISETVAHEGLRWEVEYTPTFEKQVSITLFDSMHTPLDTVSVTSIIPEPATIGLLGIGCLFLLRRRRK